jgi:hypothetical protein
VSVLQLGKEKSAQCDGKGSAWAARRPAGLVIGWWAGDMDADVGVGVDMRGWWWFGCGWRSGVMCWV